MNRRGFLSLFGLGVPGIALEQAIPLGRVWSFPTEIVIAEPLEVCSSNFISTETLQILKNHLRITEHFATDWEKGFKREFQVGETILFDASPLYHIQDV